MTIEQALLETKAVKLQPDDPFTWSSWLKSPIYCDNRMLLSHPNVRAMIVNTFIRNLLWSDLWIEGIAWVATWGIAWWALIAERLGLPFVYIRSKAKWHGRKNLVEWDLTQADNYVVVEDLISTWWSSLAAVDAMRDVWKTVLTVWAIFSYEFTEATNSFASSQCPFFVLWKYSALVSQAKDMWYVSEQQLISLQNRNEDPSNRHESKEMMK